MIGLHTMDADRNPRPPVRRNAPGNEHKLDLWLRRSLAEAHDEVLTEGVPASWIALIDKKLPPA